MQQNKSIFWKRKHAVYSIPSVCTYETCKKGATSDHWKKQIFWVFCFYIWCKLVSCTIWTEEIMVKCSISVLCCVYSLFECAGFMPYEFIFFKTGEMRDFAMWRIKKWNPLKILSLHHCSFVKYCMQRSDKPRDTQRLCSFHHSDHEMAIAALFTDSESRYQSSNHGLKLAGKDACWRGNAIQPAAAWLQ